MRRTIRSAGTHALRLLRGDLNEPDDTPTPTPPPDDSPPLRQLLNHQHPSVSPEHIVLPRTLIDTMPPPWQQQLGHLLEELHRATQNASWPAAAYRVTPLRRTQLTELDESDLRRIGIQAEYDDDGELVYRHTRTNQQITSPGRRAVLVPTRDHLPSAHPPAAASH